MPGDGHESVFAVVDGGATGTRVRLHDPARRLLGEGAGGPSSLTLGVDQAWQNIGAALREALRQAGLDGARRPPLRLAAGLAGARSPSNRAAFRAGDPFGCASIVIVTDGYASMVGALGGAPGVAAAVGTGVTAYALHPDGRVVESSGWGFPAGDEGGGAWIGHRAIQAFLKWQDGRLREDSALFDRLPRQVGGDFDAIQVWLRDARSTQFASLAPVVVAAAEAGDALAARILDAAADEVALAIAAVDAPAGSDMPLALLGGLADVIAPRIEPALGRRLIRARGSALDGLLQIALEREAEAVVAR